MRHLTFVLALLIFGACNSKAPSQNEVDALTADSIFTTPLGKVFEIPAPSEAALANYTEAKKEYEANPKDVEALIWYGRRTAYLGQYQQAIAIYTEGITNFPQDARLYRHRGHREVVLPRGLRGSAIDPIHVRRSGQLDALSTPFIYFLIFDLRTNIAQMLG